MMDPRHPGLDPGPAFLTVCRKKGGSRVKHGMTS